MRRKAIHTWARKVAQTNGFKIEDLLYEGLYYTHENVRNVMFSGIYQCQPAVLKVYDEYRITDEPRALEEFNKYNKSKILRAPMLYASEIIHPKKGWLIMERLPESGTFMQSPLSLEERERFLRLFLEYRHNWPQKPWRDLSLVEQLPAAARILHSMSRFLELANAREEELRAKGEQTILDPPQFVPRYEEALAVLQKEFKHRSMKWGHSHFKPKEICRAPDGCFYLTDFAHATMHPEGYELGFMIWADHLMAADRHLPYQKWRMGVFSWIDALRPLAQTFHIARFDDLIRACIIERTLGAILADVVASDKPHEEKLARVMLLTSLLDELLT